MQEIATLPASERAKLQKTGRRNSRATRASEAKPSAHCKKSLDYLRLSIKYLVFDLEATRRENAYLRPHARSFLRRQRSRILLVSLRPFLDTIRHRLIIRAFAAAVAELADALDSGSSISRCAGSTPVGRIHLLRGQTIIRSQRLPAADLTRRLRRSYNRCLSGVGRHGPWQLAGDDDQRNGVWLVIRVATFGCG